jgi:DnaK suppressor protein
MIKKNLARLRAKLLGDKARLEQELAKLSPPDFGSDIDHGEEQADEVEELTTRAALSGVLRGRLKRITRTLKKMRNKTYGLCENCGREIEEELLEVNPESLYCKTCKQKLNA